MAPKFYKARFIEPGIISYEDTNQGVVLVSKEALDRMAPTFRGCPVIFTPSFHNEADKDSAFDPTNPLAQSKCGIVTGIPYWGDDGWQYVDFEVEDEDVQKKIEGGYSVSCAYTPTEETGESGEWHQIPYDGEMVNGTYMHLAIVPRPRYEGSQILANSKGGHSVAIKLFGKAKANAAPPAAAPAPAAHPEPDKDDKPMMLNDDAEIQIKGVKVPLHELMTSYDEKHGESPEEISPDTQVTLPSGKTVTVQELIDDYQSGDGGGEPDADDMLNAEPPTDTPAEPVVDASKQGTVRTNSAPKVVRKVNSALKNAAAKAGDDSAMVHPETKTERLARGASRYSKAVDQGGK